MKYLIYLAVIIVLLGLNVGTLAHLKLFGGVPNLLLLLVITVALEKDNRDHMFMAVVGGLFLDFYSGVFVGSFTLAFVLVSFLLQALTKKFLVMELNWRYLWALMAGSYLFVQLFIGLYNYLAFRAGGTALYIEVGLLTSRVLPDLIYNTIFLYPVYIFGNLLSDFIDRLNRRIYS